jgi:hypothetical protein
VEVKLQEATSDSCALSAITRLTWKSAEGRGKTKTATNWARTKPIALIAPQIDPFLVCFPSSVTSSSIPTVRAHTSSCSTTSTSIHVDVFAVKRIQIHFESTHVVHHVCTLFMKLDPRFFREQNF